MATEVETVRSALRGSADRFRSVSRAHGFVPAEGSIAARQIAEQAAFAGEWASRPIEDCFAVAMLRLVAAADHLDSAARLLDDPQQVYGPPAVVRAAIECSARAWWSCDVDVDTKGRVVRAIADRASSFLEARRVGFGPITEGQTRLLERLKREAADLDLTIEIHERTETLLRVGDVRVPSVMVLLKHMFPEATSLDRDAPPDPNAGQAIYRILSGFAHAELWALMEPTRDVGRRDAGSSWRTPESRPEGVVPYNGAGLFVFFQAADRFTRLYGWDRVEWDAWRVETLKAIRRLIRDQHERWSKSRGVAFG